MAAIQATSGGRAAEAARRRLSGRPAAPTRDLALMFTDIEGFTRLCEELPGAVVAELLQRDFDMLTSRVARHGGTVYQLVGDGMFATWPGGRAAAALDAALAIRAAIGRDNRRRRDGPAVRLRVGLHAGAALMAPLGPGGRRAPLGDVVNVAQRLQDTGRHHRNGDAVTILASYAVVDRVGCGYRFAGLGPVAVRGRSQPVVAYRLDGIGA